MSERFSKIAALLGIIAFSPLMIFFSLLIFWEDGFPILFRQSRLGKKRSPFTVFKFRTMRDGKVTHIGHWLRKTGLDELPQFFNVLLGQMKIVGPRPLTPEDVIRLNWNKPDYDSRWSVKPGITGLAQIFAGVNANDSWMKDQAYISHISTKIDFKIILISLGMNLFGKKTIRQKLLKNQKSFIQQKTQPQKAADNIIFRGMTLAPKGTRKEVI